MVFSPIFSTFALAKMQVRLCASAQQNSSKLGSAFALHHNCSAIRNLKSKHNYGTESKDFRQDGAGTSLFSLPATPISLAQIPGTDAGLSGTFWVRHAETKDISSVRSKYYLSDIRTPLKVPYFKAF